MNQLNYPTTTQTVNGWHGKLDLVYAQRQGTTALIYNQNQAPLKVQRPFYPEGQEICHSVVLHTAGGVVGGDRLSCKVHLQPKAQALITTAAASKIYRSNGAQARQNIEIQIDAGACLEWLPQETIIFNGAIYRQDVRVELSAAANWMGWEITRFGRSARGEKFYTGEWRSHTEVWQMGVPLWIDRQWLPGREDVFHSPHGLAGQPVTGSLVYIGQEVSHELVHKARSLFLSSTAPNPSFSIPSPQVGVTRLSCGLLCRYRGSGTTEVRNWFTSVWQLLRQSVLARGSCIPRVWFV
ncbi:MULTISPECIES: urease accessory protein UreD [Nostocales]|uniref:Urease accessory protein UreD n=3 Tax=Nostocales TaxID=1161 RepID=A0A0C1N935_9CYAN|nr:urease accessory protein UreD [Tolypothrix bouteillei]KAF3887200.1 urease accessory protein UreD [Tolypothrix bouteillei VB521301]